MNDFDNKGMNDFLGNLSAEERKAFLKKVDGKAKDNIYNEKDIKDVIKKNIKLEQKQKSSKGLLQYNVTSQEVKHLLDNNRKSLSQALSFSEEDIKTLTSISRNITENKYTKDYFLYAFMIIDDKYFDEKKITLNDAIESKIYYTLGISSFKKITDESKRSTLFLIINFFKELGFQVYNSASISKLEEYNDMLAGLASVISFAAVDSSPSYSSTSLHINAVIDSAEYKKSIAFFVADDDVEKRDFKKGYNFYFENSAEDVFKQKNLHLKPIVEKSDNFFPEESRYERRKRLKQEANDDVLSMKFKHKRKDDLC